MILAIFYIIAILAIPFFTSMKNLALLCLLQQKAKMSTCSLPCHTRAWKASPQFQTLTIVRIL